MREVKTTTVKRHAALLRRNCKIDTGATITRLYGPLTVADLPRAALVQTNAVFAAHRLESSLSAWIDQGGHR